MDYLVRLAHATQYQSLAPLIELASDWGIKYLKEQGIDYVQDQHLYK